MYYKCKKCEINYVTEEGEICKLCASLDNESGVCAYCGGITDGEEICEICKESLKLVEHENIFNDDDI